MFMIFWMILPSLGEAQIDPLLLAAAEGLSVATVEKGDASATEPLRGFTALHFAVRTSVERFDIEPYSDFSAK